MIPIALIDNRTDRVRSDRLELLTALISAPGFDPLYRSDIVVVPPDHAVYAWECLAEGCGRVSRIDVGLCAAHHEQWLAAKAAGASRADFLSSVVPLTAAYAVELPPCRICGDRPAAYKTTVFCKRHDYRWRYYLDVNPGADIDVWCSEQSPLPSCGECRCRVCPYPADTALGLCREHRRGYIRAGRPGGAKLPDQWQLRLEPRGLPVVRMCDDESAFDDWCAAANPVRMLGVVNFRGLPPLIAAELKWGMNAHAQRSHRLKWNLAALQRLANYARHEGFSSIADLDAHGYGGLGYGRNFSSDVKRICHEILQGLRVVYHSPADTKEAGFIETDHFGHRFGRSYSTFDLTAVSQRWLRDLLWEHLAELMRSPDCPRTRGPFDSFRRACVELGAFLELQAPAGGHRPDLLHEEHGRAFVEDQLRRERDGLPSLGQHRVDGAPSIVTDVTRRIVCHKTRRLLFRALESGRITDVALDVGFVDAIPSTAGPDPKRSRSPFSDDVACALVDEDNLHAFAASYDPKDHGLRDIWEIIVVTGRRCREVTELRFECVGRYGGLPMLWHDQTKVDRYNEGIRIPERTYQLIRDRQAKTLSRYEHQHGRLPTSEERQVIALFPSRFRNSEGKTAISYGHFNRSFKKWVEDLELPASVAHQARHTLATNLLRAGASLAHIRTYLGHVSDRMAERYTTIASSDLEDALQAVWVAGPGAPEPGELLSGGTAPMSHEDAVALALDLSRRSTPADGGFCTFQPVVRGSACPRNLDCEHCDSFVLSGADLLYWRRKQEQWRSIAERAPDDATADYLHKVFEPTARAIAGLETALASLGLLEEALKLDMRRPQDYFHRIWSTNFRARQLVEHVSDTDNFDDDAKRAV